MPVEARAETGGVAWRLWALVPLVLLALAVSLVVSQGDRVAELVGGSPPPADEFDVRRVELRPGEIRVQVRNPQRDDLTIALVTVDDAIVPFTLDGPATLGRLRSSTIVVPYEWVEGEPLAIGVTSSTGIQTTHEVAAAVETPVASARGFLGYGAIGLLVGVVPVALGLLWLPSLRRVGAPLARGVHGVDRGPADLPRRRGAGGGARAPGRRPGGARRHRAGAARPRASALGMTFLSTRLSRGRVGATGLALALLVAIGIGVHNLGEGLAIGTSFATGELQLGAFLVVGFMVHNVTEGLGIAAPASRAARDAVAARGARADRGRARDRRHLDRGVRLERRAHAALLRGRRGRRAPGRRRGGPVRRAYRPGGLRSGWAMGGFLAGIAAMWATGVLAG